jgi:hypothetical protein
MRLVADENFPLPTIEALRRAGHDVTWVRTDCPGTKDAALPRQLAFRRTSSTASGCFAITASNTRVGASGCARPCSQFLSVAGGKPNLVANCAWLRPC